MVARSSVFISYSHKDKEWLARLKTHLRPLERTHQIEVWSDERIGAGDLWQEAITDALASARVAILLISADFIGSDFIMSDELPLLLQAAEVGGAVILSVVLSPSGFMRHEKLRRFQAVNNPDEPLVKLDRGSQEEVFEKIAARVATIFSEGETRRVQEHTEAPLQAPMNPRFQFSNFVVGPSNQFAHAAALAVANDPAHSYNPLFLFGGVGLGKTHLLQAIALEVKTRYPRMRVAYLAAEQFVNALINALRFDRMPEFREAYRTLDVLAIDDIQFLANKERTQEEFFHVFNTLYTDQKQVILSSDSSPRQVAYLEERLRSRFEWGLIADIQPPDQDTKVAILRQRARLEKVDLPDDVADFIAHQVRHNIRQLEAYLQRVIALADLRGESIALPFARLALQDVVQASKDSVGLRRIVAKVAQRYDVKAADITGRSRVADVAFARQVAMYLCKQIADLSFSEIGRLFSRRSKDSTMDAIAKIKQLRDSDPDFDRSLRSLEQSLL